MSESKVDPLEDLTGADREKISEIMKEKKAMLNSLQIRLKGLRSERKEQVKIVKTLRSAIIGVEASDSGRKKLCADSGSREEWSRTQTLTFGLGQS